MFRYTRVSIGFGEEGVGWDESPEELGYELGPTLRPILAQSAREG